MHGATIPMYVWDAQVERPHQGGFPRSALRHLRQRLLGQAGSGLQPGLLPQATYSDLLDALKIKQPVDLSGFLWVAALAVDFTANYPDRVKDLVLIAPMINSIKNDTNIKLLRPPVVGEFLMRLIAIKIMSDRAAQLMQKSPKAAEYAKLFDDQTRFKGFEKATLAACPQRCHGRLHGRLPDGRQARQQYTADLGHGGRRYYTGDGPGHAEGPAQRPVQAA